MQFVSWSNFVDQVALSVKGAPIAVQIQAIKAATIRLCHIARVWSHVSQTADIVAGEAKYGFVFPDMEAQVVGVKSFRLNGQELAAVNMHEWPYGDTTTGTPQIWREEEPGFVVLWPCPEQDMQDAIRVFVDLAPTLESTNAPKFLLEHYREAIKWGALAELTNTLGQAWANPNMAIADYEARFKKEIGRARIREEMGGAAGKSLRVQVPRGF